MRELTVSDIFERIERSRIVDPSIVSNPAPVVGAAKTLLMPSPFSELTISPLWVGERSSSAKQKRLAFLKSAPGRLLRSHRFRGAK